MKDENEDESTPLTGPPLDLKRVSSTTPKRRLVFALVSILMVLAITVLFKPFRFELDTNNVVLVIDDGSNNWLPSVGNYTLPITTAWQNDFPVRAHKLQRLFDNGIMNCYGFAETQAFQVAQQAVQLVEQFDNKSNHDTSSSVPTAALACPMCFWLKAMANSPFLNHPFLSPETLTMARQAAIQAKQGADATWLSLTRKERGLIDAMSVRFVVQTEGDTDNKHNNLQTQGYKAYRDALQTLHSEMPNDTDILAFYADSIMILHCDSSGYHFYEVDNRTPLPEIATAITLLERCLELSTTTVAAASSSSSTTVHPLCAYLYIHVTEPSLRPQRANAAADQLAAGWNNTQAQHLQHMPSHTFLRVGRYHDALWANIQAHTSDSAWLQQGQLPYGPAHNLAFLVHAAGLSGERSMAYHYADILRGHYRAYPDQPDGPGPEEGWHIWRTVHLRFGDWDAVLSDPDDFPLNHEWPYAVILGHFAKGVAVLGSKGQAGLVAAKDYLQRLQDTFFSVGERHQRLARVANWTLSSGIAYFANDPGTALDLIQLARREQESWTYSEPPSWYMTEAACEGVLLATMGRYKEAIAMYEHDLGRIAENRFSLYGLQESMQKSQEVPMAEVDLVRARYTTASQWVEGGDPPIICPQMGQ